MRFDVRRHLAVPSSDTFLTTRPGIPRSRVASGHDGGFRGDFQLIIPLEREEDGG